MALALDELKETDSVYDASEFKFIVDNELITQTGHIEVDFKQYGFTIKPEIELSGPSGCGGCSCDKK